MKDNVVEEAMRIRGVRGAAAIAASGKVAASSIGSGELNEFFELLFRQASPGKPVAGLGQIRRIAVRTDKEEVLSLLVGGKGALGLVSEKWRPLAELCADAKALLSGV